MTDEEIRRLAEQICARLGIQTTRANDSPGETIKLVEAPGFQALRKTLEDWITEKRSEASDDA